MSRQLKADMALLFVTIGWGASFILTKNSLASLETFNFLAIRFILAFSLSFIVFYKRMIKLDKETIKYGFLIGFILFSGFALQTIGLSYTTVSKSAFITGFSVILVPVFSAFLLKKIPEKASIAGAGLALIGLALLTLNGKLGLNIGDFYTLLSALAFAMHIITVGKYTVKVDSIGLGVIQIGAVGLFSLLTTLVIEKPIIPSGGGVWINLFILSIVCTSGAFILQSTAQKFTSATHTALIYAGEPVFAAIFAYFIYGEILSPRGILGALLILSGMILAEVDLKKLLGKDKVQKITDSLPS